MNEMFLADNLYIFGDYRVMQYELQYEVKMLRIFLHLFFLHCMTGTLVCTYHEIHILKTESYVTA